MSLTARHIMTPDPVTVSPKTLIVEASRIMLERRFNGLPVVNDNGELLGIVCQSDLVNQHKKFRIPSFFFLLDGFIPLQSPRKMEEDIERMAAAEVGQIMTHKPYTITPDTTLDEIAVLMVDKKYHTLPVVEGGKLVGIVGKEDMLRTMAENAGK